MVNGAVPYGGAQGMREGRMLVGEIARLRPHSGLIVYYTAAVGWADGSTAECDGDAGEQIPYWRLVGWYSTALPYRTVPYRILLNGTVHGSPTWLRTVPNRMHHSTVS